MKLALCLGGLICAVTGAQAPPGKPMRYLLSDPRWIESQKGFERRMHQPVKSPVNPVIKADLAWEHGAVFVNGGPAVVWDERDRIYKMWYFTYTVTRHEVPNNQSSAARDNLQAAAEGGWVESFIPSFATSTDGVHWEKASLGLKLHAGSTANSMLNWPSQEPQGGTNVLLDSRDSNPHQRYKSLFYSYSPEDKKTRTGLYVSFSADGLHWNDFAGNPVLTNVHDTHTIFGWDDSVQKYVAYLRPKLEDTKVRVIGRSESADFIHWTDPGRQVVLRPDARDAPGDEFYGMPVAKFNSLYYGLIWVYHNTPHWPFPLNAPLSEEQLTGSQQTVETQLATSVDGIQWSREGDRSTFLPVGKRGEWDDGMVYPTTPIETDDEFRIYYGGFNVLHTLESLSQLGKTSGGRVRGASIGLAILRLDGFVSEHAATAASLTTKPVTFAGNTLLLNADLQSGTARVEVEDEAGRPIPGLAFEDCAPIHGDSVRHRVRWKDGNALARVAGQPVRLRFEANDGDLYAFRFTTETSAPAGSMKAAADLLQHGHALEARRSLESLAAQYRGDPDLWNALGVARDQDGDHPAATVAFQKALELAPRNPRVHFNLGLSHQDHGHADAAIREFSESLRLDPAQPRAHGRLAAAYASLGKFQPAAAHAEQEVKLAAEDSDARILWGEILSNLGLFEKALSQFQTVTNTHPGHTLATLRAGQCLKLLGRWAEALDALQGAAGSDYRAEVLAAMGEIYLEQGNLDESSRALRLSARLNPKQPAVWYQLARCEIRRGEWSTAADHLRRSIALDPDQAQARYQLGRTYQQLGNVQAAELEFQVFQKLEARQKEQRKSAPRLY